MLYIIMYSKMGQSNQSNQRVGTFSTKETQRVGTMARQGKPTNKTSQIPNIKEQEDSYNKYS